MTTVIDTALIPLITGCGNACYKNMDRSVWIALSMNIRVSTSVPYVSYGGATKVFARFVSSCVVPLQLNSTSPLAFMILESDRTRASSSWFEHFGPMESACARRCSECGSGTLM